MGQRHFRTSVLLRASHASALPLHQSSTEARGVQAVAMWPWAPEDKSALPVVGGEVARRLNRLRDGVLEGREALVDECAALPSLAEFFAGRHVLLTGGSGFVGRILVETLLRTCPDVGNLYLVLRTKRGVAPKDRLRHLLDVPLFDRVRAERPAALDKIVVLPGDGALLRLGLSDEHQELLKKDVSVVFHLAASVRFDDPFKKAVFTNLRSTREVVQLARDMPQLRVLVHVSTAYTNIDQKVVEERLYTPEMDWRDVLRWAESLDDQDPHAIDNLGHKVLGFQPNTYTFTKALAEKLIDDVSEELPVIIVRPSIVMGTVKDPFPGWIDNLLGLGGFLAGGMKGVVKVLEGPDVFYDTIPADVVAKVIILAARHRALDLARQNPRSTPGPPGHPGAAVINATVGDRAGISVDEMQWALTEKGVGRAVPYPGVLRPPSIVRFQSKLLYALNVWYHHILFGFIVDLLARATGRKPRYAMATCPGNKDVSAECVVIASLHPSPVIDRVLDIYRKMTVAMQATAPFRVNVYFVNDGLFVLQTLLNPRDARDYCFVDLCKARDSREDFREPCVALIRGILVHALKEKDDPRRNWLSIQRMKWIHAVYNLLMATLFFIVVYFTTLRKQLYYLEFGSKYTA